MTEAVSSFDEEWGLTQCPHGFHHPRPYSASYPHSCDGCWCEGERDRLDYGWDHDTNPGEREDGETDDY